MAGSLFLDGYKRPTKDKKKDEQKKKTEVKKPQSSSAPKKTTSNANNKASNSTFLGGGASVKKVEKAVSKPKTVKKPATTKKQTLSTNTTAAQRQKMGMPTSQDLKNAKQSRQKLATNAKNIVSEVSSEENRGFMQRQKSGTQTSEDLKKARQMNQRRAKVVKNTGAAATKAVQDTVSGYGQTLADVDEMAKSNRNWTTAKAQKMGIDLNDRARVAKVEQERQQSIKEAREFRQELFDKQEQRQAKWDERTKNAKGLEKAWYGAVESGAGMLADTLVGAATGTGQFGALASMGLRTYGPSANQARKEGATDKEARLYGLAQSGKEMATELMFQGAGLAKAAYGKTGLSLADKAANTLTKGLTGIKADVVGAGVRALGGTAEENVEELAGWMADPVIKELTYGKNVRKRMQENLRANIPQIGSDADAANVASYFSTPKFTDDLTKEYVKSGMSKDKASALAAEMRDYYVAYYSGDQAKLAALEEDLAAKLSGQDKLSLKSWSMDELKDTLASTTLLTLATGMPGAVNSSIKGNRIFDSDEVKAVFGADAVRKVADAVKNTSNREMSLKAETMKDRLDSGMDLTGTQKFDLYQGYLEKVNETSKKARASYGVVENAREEQDLVPTMGRDRNGNTVFAKQTQREYNEKFASTELTVEAIKNYMESDNSISDDESRRANAVKKAVADLHVGGLTVGDAHEFAYGNDLAREALKAEEGIDLDKYVVRKADGTVDLAATNEATENALFQINADNAIRTAQAETEVFIDDTRGNIDKDLLTRFGNSGQAVWKEVNKDLDPRNLQEYLTNANAASYFYSAGRNTDMSVDSAINRYADTFKTVDNTVLKRAFAAGARDRIIANTPGYGQTVEAGSNIQLKKTKPIITGQLIMDKDVVIPDSDQSAYLALAMSTNTNIHIVSNLNAMGKDGKPIINQATGLPVQINGMSHGNDIYLNVNEASEKNLGYVFMHEMTHQIKQYAPNEYLALENLVRDRWFNKDAVGMQAAIKQRMDLYSIKGGQQLTEEEAVEEIIADAMAEAMDDPNFAAEVCEQDINLGQAILNSIRAALRSIRQMFANIENPNDRFHNSLLSYLDILDEAEKMWLNALATAKQNKADGLIADWQDRANKQNSPRLSVGEEKYSITTDKEDFIKGANLSKELRDWSKEMGLDKLSKQPIKGPVIVSVRDLRTAWYEKNGRTDEANVINTALDKIGDSLTQLVGKYQYIDLGDALNAAVTYRTDAEGHPTSVILSCQVKNAEYEVNFDFTTICAKRLAMQKILERFIKTEGERQGTTLYDELKLDEEGLYKLRLILETAGFEVSCRGCFVEQNRYSQQNQARTIANDWNKAIDDWEKENNTKVTENFDLVNMDINALNYDEIQDAFNNYSDLMSGRDTNVETKNRTLIEAHPFFRKRMNPSDYASMTGQRALMAIGVKQFRTKDGKSKKGTTLYGLLKRGQSDSKQSVPFTAYNGEVALLPDKMKGKSLYDYLISIGGARAQSASDFQIEFLYDYMQLVADLSARNLPMHMYTKVIELAELFGMTGIKINLSAMCDVDESLTGEYAGLKLVDGKYEYNISDQSIDYPKAVELQKKEGYSKNIGIIMVTLSSQHMLKSLDDPDVRYIIGYHSSAMPVVVANMSKMGNATDYTKLNKTSKLSWKGEILFEKAKQQAKGDTELARFKDALRIFDEMIQTETEETAKKKNKPKPRRGNEYGTYMTPYKGNTADFNTYDDIQKTNDARKTADNYIEWCMNNDYIPMYFPFAFHDNYYKCEVYDFNMYDNVTGEYAPMQGVQNIYPGLNMAAGETDTTAFMNRVSEMMSERNAFNEVQSAMYEPVMEEAKRELRYSITGDDYMDFDASGIDHSELTHRADAAKSEAQLRDEAYMDAVNSGNMEEAQRLVDEAAKDAGYTTPKLYHGTPSFGFTKFDLSKGEMIIFATNSRLTAETYSGETERNKLSDKSNIDVDSLSGDALLNEASKYRKKYSDYQLMTPAEQERMLDESREEVKLFAQDAANFIEEHKDSFDEEKLAIANRIVDSINRISNAWAEDMVDAAWNDFEDAMWDLKWMDESIQLELTQALQEGGSLLYWKNKISDMMYSGDIYRNKSYENEYIFDNQLALELDADLGKGIYGLYANPGNQLVIEANGSNWNQIIPPDELNLYGLQRTRSIAEAAKAKGYDSVLFRELRDNGGATAYNGDSDVYMFFNPSQVKSADTITYAEDGSVIPLSERFDPTNDDIRYSLPTTDSDGNVLSDGQMEYFKNSQARDEQGRLVKVFHTTNYGGFTIFDPSYSDDKRSLFFASNWDVSQTYGYKAKAPINLTPTNRVYATWAEVENDIKNRFPEWLEEEDMISPFLPPETIKTSEALNAFVFHKNDHTYADELGVEEGFDKWVEMSENGEDTSDYYVMLTVPKAQGSIDIKADSLSELLTKLANELDTGQGKQRGYYSCYLNLENPLIVDAKGHNWNDIPYGPEGNSLEDHLVDLEERADMVIRSILAVQGGYDDDGWAHKMDVRIQYRTKDENGEWSSLQTFEDTVDLTDTQFEDEGELSYELWDLTEDILTNFGLPVGYINDLETDHLDYDGDINWTPEQRGDDIPFDYIMRSEDQYEIVDRWDFDREETYRTRELAELAEEQGYDGVIIRDCKDIGGASRLKGNNPYSDIFIAFSSNQVKDINNENPTENPDIRYSITPEDDAKSQIAYDDAMDDSYELLAYYEQQLNVVNPETFDVTKAFKEEDVVRFLDALKAEDSVPADDPKFEEDRVRRAKSKEEFYSSVNAKWNDRWITEGEVLKISSVKRDITNLVKGAMANSNSDAQYRNEIVRKTLLDARIAYQLMKQDRTELASYLLYHSAQRMIDGLEFIRDDTAFKEYKEIRDFLRTYRINAPEEYWENEKFLDFRKEYYGRLRIGKGISNIEDVYKDCQDRWPHLFNEAEREKADNLGDSPEDLLLHIGVVVDSNVTPFMEAYSSEEATSLTYDLADQLYEIIANGDREVSLADSYKERFDAKTKALKQRHAEAILRERKIREEGIQKERQKFRAYKEQQKEKKLHAKNFEGIKNKYDELTKRLLTNTKDKHIPEQYKKELAGLLKAFDFQTVGSKKREARTGYKAQNTIKLEAMRTALEHIETNSQFFHINDSVTDIIKELLGLDESSANRQTIEGKTLDELNASELKKIDKLLGALLHEFNNYEKVKVGIKKQQAADIGHAQNDISLDHADMFGPGKDYINTPGWVDKILNLDEMTAAYLFKRIDPNNEGLGLMYKEIRRSFDKYVRNQNQLNEWMEEIVGKYHNKGILWNKYGSGELTNWRSDNYAHTFNLENGTIRLTIAQMMSVACLANRKQAYDHMIGNGVVVSPVTFNAKTLSDLKKKPNKALPVRLTDADIKTIVAQLTPEQRQVANKLQELMATKMADWGNEASTNVIGIKLFEDPDYFPIRSDRAGLTKDLDPNQFEQAIRNFGFAKAVQPGAKNAIMIDDIFDVVTEHCNNMNLYNSYTEAMNDFMKVYNYRETREEGEYTVEQALRHAYSDKVPTFIMQFMRDLNGNVSKRASGIEDAYNSLLANSKKAAVFANLRVAAQQPTAITRAFAVIDPKYIKGIRVGQGDMQEMFEHCPIALWKSWGYYDINMGKSIEDIMMNNGRWLEDKATDLYGALDNVTWTAIWQMVKAEMKDTHPDVKAGTDEYWELCNERMSEIVDLTQVVDSPMHRSHAMRDKGFLKKTATAFMAEPTLTFNMIRDGVIRSREAWRKGDKAEAAKIAARTGAVALLQAATVGGMAAIVDALRKKKPDKDDDDDRFLHLWWVNALENFENELKVWNKIYFIKDIASIFDGWDNANLALQGIQKFALGYRQLTGDPYARSSAEWYENMADGIGYMSGVPIKTMRTGLSNAMEALGIVSPALAAAKEQLDSMAKDSKSSDAETSGFIGGLLSDDSSGLFGKLLAAKADTAESEETSEGNVPTRDSLPDNLTDEQKDDIIKSAERRSKKATPEEEQEQLDYDKMLYDAMKAASGLEGEEYNKKVYSSVANGLKGYIADGDYMSIGMMRTVIEQAGGDVAYFDQRVLEETKSAYKKTLSYDLSYEERWNQKAMYRYMMSHGMTQEELSSEILYKSDLAKDMKVAYRIGDNNTIYEAMLPLVDAGITETDLERLYENRNRMDLTKYKQNGRYKDRLKSMGTFIWPATGVIRSHFGYRNAPTRGASSNHPAIDIGVPVGTPVAAADGGVVIYAGHNSGYGNSVGIKHDNGMVTYYNHLDSWNVKVGDTVAQGQQIACSGNTGISTGPHLDFKILDADGNPVDPEKYLGK